jgi:hypothetical protein
MTIPAWAIVQPLAKLLASGSEYCCRSCRPFRQHALTPVSFRSRQVHCLCLLGLERSDLAWVALGRESREVPARETEQAQPLMPA